jgi:hypothetical protein
LGRREVDPRNSEECAAVKIHRLAILAGAGFAMLLAGPALAKPVHAHAPAHRVHHAHAGLRYAQSYYNYQSASSVRESFRDGPTRSWRQAPRGRWQGGAYRGRQDDLVVENLRGDFNGGVGYGTDGDLSFTDGYGQIHFFTGSFAHRAGFGSHRFGPQRFGMQPGFTPGRGFARGR